MEKTSTYILNTSRDYALYVASHRAIPSAADGLKDSQRIALWLMRNRADKIKVSALNGDMSGSNLYVHGDAAGTISLLAAPYLNNVTFLEPHGAFGTRVDPYSIGAPRYVSVKKSKAAEALLYRDMDVIELMENYDGSNMQPVTFLPIIPTVLLNGISGIAVGWSTDILPHSLPDLVRATIQAIEQKPITKIKPNYSYTKCSYKELGPNVWEISGCVEFVDSSSVRVTELPPELPLEKFRERLDALEEEGKIKDYSDNSSENIDVLVKFSRGTVKKENIDSYIDTLKLRARKTERIVVIDFNGKRIKQYTSPEELVLAFVDWRFGHYIRRYENMLKNDSYELIFWKGVKACFDDEMVKDLTSLKNKKEVVARIDKAGGVYGLKLDTAHLDKIATFPTYRWTLDEYQDVLKKIAELEDNVKTYKDLLSHPDKIRTIFKTEVKALEKLS